MANNKIKSLTIKGFKSISLLEDFKPSQINVLIGGNGAGKSNFIAFFRLLSWCVNSTERFQTYIGSLGGASAILFDGPDITQDMVGHIEIETDSGSNEYHFRLLFSAGDSLVFAEEKTRFSPHRTALRVPWIDFGAGHKESKLQEYSDNPIIRVISVILKKLIVYQFHNTSPASRIRNKWSTRDGRWLKEDGANLGSFLLRLSEEKPAHYQRMVRLIRMVLPFFEDFILEDEQGYVLLRWKETESQMVFDASQASDGMIRFFALVALLAQPVEDLPSVVFIDEPELGLHPVAINVLAGLIKKASANTQFFISTQSVSLVSEFEPEDIVVVEREGRASVYKRPDSAQLGAWLEEYSLGQLWEQNVIGGRPS